MIFNNHLDLQGKHAKFSPSQSSWLRYDDDKILNSYLARHRKALGTELHEFANIQIELVQKQKTLKDIRSSITTYIYTKYKMLDKLSYGKSLIQSLNEIQDEVIYTLKIFVNDAIGFKMLSEQPLVYSYSFFGTADSISFRNDCLRIHDLKTGDGKADFEQLLIYVALFCLEYKIKPTDIQIECRIYQFGEAHIFEPELDDIIPIMDKILRSNAIIESRVKEEEI